MILQDPQTSLKKMIYQTEMMGISEVRGIVKRVVREEPTHLYVVQAARNTLLTMCQEAAQYGLTTADVLNPYFPVRMTA